MGNLYPYLRDVEDFRHKLWDHLAIMSDFKLDIDYPYELPSPDILTEKPNSVPYPQHNIKYRHYGLVVEKMINKAAEMEDGEEKKILIEQTANQMKKLFMTWNKDAVEDEKIFKDMEEISRNKLQVPRDITLMDTRAILSGGNKKKKKKNK